MRLTLERKILGSNLPLAVMASMISTMVTFVNILLIGTWMTDEDLAAATSSSMIGVILTVFCSVLATGGSIMFSRRLSSAYGEKASNSYTVVMILAVIFGAAFLIGCAIVSYLVGLAPGSDLAGYMSGAYIMALGVSGIPMLLLSISIMFLRIDNDRPLSILCFIVFVASDVLLIYFTNKMYGELMWVGLSVAFASLIALALVPLHLRVKERKMRFVRPGAVMNEMKALLSIGTRTVINRICSVVRYSFLNAFAVAIGAGVLCLASQSMVMHFVVALFSGCAIMINILSGLYYSQGDRTAVKASVREAAHLGILISLAITVFILIMAWPITALIAAGSGYEESATWCLVWYSLSFPTSTVCMILIYTYQATKRKPFSIVLTILRGVAFMMAVVGLSEPYLGISAVWISFLASDLLMILTAVIAAWVYNRRFPRDLDDLLMLEGRPKFEEPSVFEGAIYSKREELDNLLGTLSSCLSWSGMDDDSKDKITGRVEELVGKIIDEGYDDGREHPIEILVRKDGNVIVRDEAPRTFDLPGIRHSTSIGMNTYFISPSAS